MIISAIWAQSKNGVIGVNNQIPWHLPDDLKFFKRTTLGHHIITGRKNYESVGKPLPGRTNVIVTRNRGYAVSGCPVVHSVEDALSLAHKAGEEEVFIVGGGEIYKAALPYLQKLYMTLIDTEIEGDVYFPEIDWTKWDIIGQEDHPVDERHKFSFSFKVFEPKPRRITA